MSNLEDVISDAYNNVSNSDLEDVKPDADMNLSYSKDIKPYPFMNTWAFDDVKPVVKREEADNLEDEKPCIQALRASSDLEDVKPDADMNLSYSKDIKPYPFMNTWAFDDVKPVVKREEADNLEDEKPCIQALRASVLLSTDSDRQGGSVSFVDAGNKDVDSTTRSLVTGCNTDNDHSSLISGRLRTQVPRLTPLNLPSTKLSKPPMTAAERVTKAYHKRKQENPEDHKVFLEQRKKQSKQRRERFKATATEEEKALQRAKARERLIKHRQKKRELGIQNEKSVTRSAPRKPVTRSAPRKPVTRRKEEEIDLRRQRDRERKKLERQGWSQQNVA